VEYEQLKKKKILFNQKKEERRCLPIGAPNRSTRPELNRTRLSTSKLTNELFDDG
jgi:hypothetical protein